MDFLVVSHAIPESEFPSYTEEDEQQLNERHWSYMDTYADRFTARGPLLGPGRDSWRGSMHIVDLPDAGAARGFYEEEPYQQTGLFAAHSVWQFTNLLGRTMWEYDGASDDPKFLVVAEREGHTPAPADRLGSPLRGALVVYGALAGLDGTPAGTVLAAQLTSRDDLDPLLHDPNLNCADVRANQIHDWEFGGRR